MEEDGIKSVQDLLYVYKKTILGIDERAKKSDRAAGGVQRSIKGALVELLAYELVKKAWSEIGGPPKELKVLKNKKVKVSLKRDYLRIIRDREVAKHIESNLPRYTYSFGVDVSAYIRNKLALAIECKAYAENAMLKRILFDGSLIKEMFPDAEIVLFQLESQLGGDYAEIYEKKHFGSESTHTLMSYFDYELSIITLLKGDRKVNKPIHKRNHFKEMERESLEKALFFFKRRLERHLP